MNPSLLQQSDTTGKWLEWLQVVFQFVFSSLILMVIAVIVSGHLLAHRFKLNIASHQVLRIPIPNLVNIQATGEQVILGFGGLIVSLMLIGLSAGSTAYTLFKSQFGIDPGQFNALCILSSFATVFWSGVLFVISVGLSTVRDPAGVQRDAMVNKLAKEGQGDGNA